MKTFKENFLPAAAAAVQPLLMGSLTLASILCSVFGEGKLSNYKIVTTIENLSLAKV